MPFRASISLLMAADSASSVTTALQQACSSHTPSPLAGRCERSERAQPDASEAISVPDARAERAHPARCERNDRPRAEGAVSLLCPRRAKRSVCPTCERSEPTLPDASEAIGDPRRRAERALLSATDRFHHSTRSRPSCNLACSSARPSRAGDHNSPCERVETVLQPRKQLPHAFACRCPMRAKRSACPTRERSEPTRPDASEAIGRERSERCLSSARRERSDQRARRASGASRPCPMQAKRSAIAPKTRARTYRESRY